MAIETLYSKEMARWYDEMYCDEKATQKQIKFLTKIFKKHKVKSVLDVACGTGRHSIELEKRGYDVVGIDLEPGMLACAKENAKAKKVDIKFLRQDMRKINVRNKFDAAIIFFTAFAYMNSNEDVLQALQSVHKRLKKSGILIIETFFGWPKIVEGEFRMKLTDTIKKNGKLYKAISEHSLDLTNNYMSTTQTHIRYVDGKKLKTVRDKKPTILRLFFPNELDLFFRLSGFKTVDFYGNVNGDRLSNKHHERLIAVAKKSS